jgi:hypothetical protein
MEAILQLAAMGYYLAATGFPPAGAAAAMGTVGPGGGRGARVLR